MTSGVHMIVLVGWMIALLAFYHKIFTVYYFDLGHGLLKELGASFILGLIMTTLTFYFWWLTAIIIIIAGLSFKKKLSSNTPLIIAVVLAVIVALLGISMRNEKDHDEATYAQDEESMVKASAERSVEGIIEMEEEIGQAEVREAFENISNNLKYVDTGDSGAFLLEDAEGNILLLI